jgi:hypothetical protein
MYLKFLLKVSFYSAVLTGGLYVAGCSKNERSITEAMFTQLELKTFSIDTLQLKVQANEILLTDSLFAPDGKKDIPVQFFDPKQRIRLYDLYTNRMWLDTVIDYKPGFVNSLTFFQPAPAENFVWIGPPVNEPLAPKDYLKMSVIYTDAALPDVVKIVVSNKVTTSYTPTDSFELRKGAFSRYFLARNTADRRPRFDVFTADGQRKLKAQADELSFPTTFNPDYNIYLLRKTNSSGSVFKLKPEKLY